MFKPSLHANLVSGLPTDLDIDFISLCESACALPGGKRTVRAAGIPGFQTKARTEVITHLDRRLRDAKLVTAKPVPA